jgi:phosphate transport system protein
MEKHISSQFDADLTSVSSRVLELGGLVESQTRHAVYALAQFSLEVADQVIDTEKQVNKLEVSTADSHRPAFVDGHLQDHR